MKKNSQKRQAPSVRPNPAHHHQPGDFFRRTHSRKGQFLLIFGFLMLVTLVLALPKRTPLLTAASTDLSLIRDNLMREFPRAFNFGVNESAPADRLLNFSRFVQRTLRTQYINASFLWAFSQVNTANNNTNITAANFLERNITLSINLSGTVQNITLTQNTTNSSLFSAVSTSPFNITFQAGADVVTLEWQRDKFSLFLLLTIKRELEFLREEINA